MDIVSGFLCKKLSEFDSLLSYIKKYHRQKACDTFLIERYDFTVASFSNELITSLSWIGYAMNCCKQHELNCLLMHREVQFMSRKAQFTKSQISIYAVRQFIEKEIILPRVKLSLFLGGGEENRTPVRKSIHPRRYECSLWFGVTWLELREP